MCLLLLANASVRSSYSKLQAGLPIAGEEQENGKPRQSLEEDCDCPFVLILWMPRKNPSRTVAPTFTPPVFSIGVPPRITMVATRNRRCAPTVASRGRKRLPPELSSRKGTQIWASNRDSRPSISQIASNPSEPFTSDYSFEITNTQRFVL